MYLTTHTYYSLKYGTLTPRQLVAAASSLGIKTLALTDINNCSCAYQFIMECRKHQIKPVLGIEFRRDHQFLYTGIAKNREGWKELCKHLTEHSLNEIPLADRAPAFRHVFVIYQEAPAIDLRSNEFVGIRPDEVNRLFSSPLRKQQEKLVIFSPVSFLDEDGYKIHRIMRCVDLNIVIGKLEAKDCGKASDRFHSPEALEAIFQQYPKIIENSKQLLARCSVEMPSDYDNNRRTFTGNVKDDFKLLSKLSIEGCLRRYSETHKVAFQRTKKELRVIQKLGFCSYFLITWDIVRYAQSAGYHHVGRGSGANSIVAFNLGITDVDPLELDLYFERFINPHRSSPPDFDIDFSWDERDDVTDYIFKRYGKEHTALLATYNTFKGKSIIRELGKVLGLPKEDIDTIVNQPLATEKHHPFAKYIFKYGKMIEGFPNYLSIHAGGILISEEPLNYFTALQMMPKGFPITHFDMYGAEDLGFHKYDILSQRGLGHIKDSVDLIYRNRGKYVDIHNVQAIKENKDVQT